MDIIISILYIIISWLFNLEPGTATVKTGENIVTAEVVEVIDGDTIRVLVAGSIETVRYIGIDTPEPYRDGEPACFSLEASERNETLVAGKTVTLVADDENVDKYDRLLRYVYIDDVFVNRTLVEEGYATTLSIPPNTTHASEFSVLETEARANGLGLWSACR